MELSPFGAESAAENRAGSFDGFVVCLKWRRLCRYIETGLLGGTSAKSRSIVKTGPRKHKEDGPGVQGVTACEIGRNVAEAAMRSNEVARAAGP
jgi:hypothetical protein